MGTRRRGRGLATAALLGFLGAALGACELQEITITTPEDVVIAEVVLRAGSPVQSAWLHRTASDAGTAAVIGAAIVVSEVGTGRAFSLDPMSDSTCLAPPREAGAAPAGSCYAVRGTTDMVRTGASYDLRIDLPDGTTLIGNTTVPGSFALIRPSAGACELPPDTILDLRWARSDGAKVYIVDSRLSGLREALRARGATVPGSGPVELTGLSITGEDTTLVFPRELGLFDRFEDDLHPILVAIRDGLPPDVRTEVAVAAADRNFVNWVRGGSFNPSGQVRVSSLRGNGAGMFGSLVTEFVEIRVPAAGAPPQGLPPC